LGGLGKVKKRLGKQEVKPGGKGRKNLVIKSRAQIESKKNGTEQQREGLPLATRGG